MAIYNRWNNELTVTENLGEHQPKYFKYPATLVKIKFTEDGVERYAFAEFLKATNGWPEIQRALDAAQPAALEGKALKEAYRQAE